MKHSAIIVLVSAIATVGCDKNPDADEATQQQQTADETAAASETSDIAESESAAVSSDAPTEWSITFPNGELPDLAGAEVKLEPRGSAYLFAGAPALVRLEADSPPGADATPEEIKQFSIVHTKARQQCIYERDGKNLKFDFKATSEGAVTRLDFDGMLRCASLSPKAEAPLTKVTGTLRIQ